MEEKIPMAEELSIGNTAQNCRGSALDADEFLEQNYRFRRNVLSDKVEHRLIEESDEKFQTLTSKALNSIVLRSRREGFTGKNDISKDLKLLVDSDDIPLYDPIADWLKSLKWDGVDRVVAFWERIPGMTAELIYLINIWQRSMVAHWLGLDTEHGNECVPTLIGPQGCGKSHFCIRILPPHLRQYYLDNFHLANKFDKDMALTNSLLICLDEMDQYKSGQQAELKQALSKARVNGRKIFGRVQEDRQRYASFIATTNNPRPLMDVTGSRRYICVNIPAGKYINNDDAIDYEQLYAQIYHEVVEKQERYWFTNDETLRIQEMNAPYQQVSSLEQMVDFCVGPLADNQEEQLLSTDEIINEVKAHFPMLDLKKLTKAKVGNIMKGLGYEKRHRRNGEFYIATIRKAS